MYELVPTVSWHEGAGWLHIARRSLCLAVVWTGSQKVAHEAGFLPKQITQASFSQ